MSTRNLLHKDKLEQFKAFLDSKEIEYREGKGTWEVLQVWNRGSKRFDVIHTSMRGDHFSVPQRLLKLVNRFIKSEYNISWQSK